MVGWSRNSIAAYLLAALPFGAMAHENGAHWERGFGQGICVAAIQNGAFDSIHVNCECGSGKDDTSILFTLAGKYPTGNSVFLTFNGAATEAFAIQDGQITSDCRACAANFDAVVSLLKSHRSVNLRFENGDNATFTLAGSSKAIGECVADFNR